MIMNGLRLMQRAKSCDMAIIVVIASGGISTFDSRISMSKKPG